MAIGYALGKAFSTMGKGLPGVGESFRQAAEDERKKPFEQLALLIQQQQAKKGGMELTEAERQSIMAEEGRKKLGEFETDVQDASKMQAAPNEFMGGMGPISNDRYEKLAEIAKLGPLKYAQSSGLAKYSPYESGVKSTLDLMSAQEGNGQQDAKAAEIWRRLNAKPEDFERAKKYAEELKGIGVSDALISGFLSEVGEAGSGDPLGAIARVNSKLFGTEEGLRGKKLSIPINAENAAATNTAGTRAKITSQYETQANIPGSFKQNQYTAGNYALRIEESEKELNELSSKGFNPSNLYNMIKSPDALNAIKDPDQRRYAQAARNYINATLRRESGAAIAKSEFDNASKQYFAQLNDDQETLQQKQKNRLQVLSAFKSEAGGAFDQIKKEYNSNLTKPKENNFESFWNEINK